MTSKINLFLSFVFCFCLFASADILFAEEPKQKHIIFIADWGDEEPPEEVISLLVYNPMIKLAIPWPSSLEPTDQVKYLAESGQIEPILTIENEPILPLIYKTEIPAEPKFTYSYPQDIWDIVAKNNIQYRSYFQRGSKGLYLRSGIFGEKTISGLKNLGLTWANRKILDPSDGIGYVRKRFLVLNMKRNYIHNPEKSWRWITGHKEDVVAIVFSKSWRLNYEFLSYVGQQLLVNKDVKMIVPQDIFSNGTLKKFPRKNLTLDADLNPWIRDVNLWKKLYMARRAIRAYKNSGKAELNILDVVKNELNFIYKYDTFAKAQANSNSEEYQIVCAGISNIYRFLKIKEPKEADIDAEEMDEEDFDEENVSQKFKISRGKYFLGVHNTPNMKEKTKLTYFSVALSSWSVNYRVHLLKKTTDYNCHADIYIDMNNKRGAGLVRLLPGKDAFLDPKNAWEYAIRIKDDSAELYKASRFNPVLVKAFDISEGNKVLIPKSILRGNPLNWGYQAVALHEVEKVVEMEKKVNDKPTDGEEAEPETEIIKEYEISDFLCRDDYVRRKTLKSKTIQLRTIRDIQ
ncbi:hypothetical protein ACFL58_00210 [Elusimicrobiota bacterium]